MVIVFALMADGEDGYGCAVFDFKKDDIATVPEWDQHLP